MDTAYSSEDLAFRDEVRGFFEEAYTAELQTRLRSPDYKNAIEEYQKAIELEPLFAAAFNGLGSSYSQSSQLEKAIEAYLEATKLGPNYAKPQFGLGWA